MLPALRDVSRPRDGETDLAATGLLFAVTDRPARTLTLRFPVRPGGDFVVRAVDPSLFPGRAADVLAGAARADAVVPDGAGVVVAPPGGEDETPPVPVEDEAGPDEPPGTDDPGGPEVAPDGVVGAEPVGIADGPLRPPEGVDEVFERCGDEVCGGATDTEAGTLRGGATGPP